MLPVTIDGSSERIEALIVHPTADGRFPIALIVNGSSTDASELHAAGLAHLAHDFAHRGWLAASVIWRGYGGSSGQIQRQAGTCPKPEVARFLNAHADDLAAVLTAIRARSDVDPVVALGLGVSIGGVSMLDLAARSDHPLTAVINISGGLYHDAKPFVPDPACGPFEADLVQNLKSFGAANPVPTLWLYAENDPWFRPVLVQRMLSGYRSTGGQADLTMFPPWGSDGHTLYTWEANSLTQPVIDGFLRRNALPALESDDAFSELLDLLKPAARASVEEYLQVPTEKALAMPDGADETYWHYASRSIDDARRVALSNCRAASGRQCRLIAENRQLLGGWREILPSPAN